MGKNKLTVDKRPRIRLHLHGLGAVGLAFVLDTIVTHENENDQV